MDRVLSVPEKRGLPADPPRVNDYDVLAEAYTAENETSLFNAYYERPATLALAGDVAGRRMLKPGGRLIASVDHPFAIVGIQRQAGRKPDYFATYNWTEDW